MSAKRLLVVYYSAAGRTGMMAEAIGRGAEGSGVVVSLKRSEECGLNDLVEADGIVIGSPTYFSNVAWQVKKLIDDSIALYRKDHQLKGKIGGCFTSSGTRGDGLDCIRMLELAFGRHHKLDMVPGIVMASGDRDEEVLRTCQRFGAEIAKRILS